MEHSPRLNDTVWHPAFGSEIRVGESYVPDDPDGQVGGTIALMRRYCLEDSAHPDVVRDLREACGTTDPGGLPQRAVVDRVFGYVKGRIAFQEDGTLAGVVSQDPLSPVVEVLIRPRDMAVMCGQGACRRVGDCDDFSMYTAALLLAAGIKCAFVTVAADQAEPDRFSHVYVAAYPDGQRVAMDTSHGPHCGWETGGVTRKEEWPLTGASQLLQVGLLVGLIVWMRQGGVI